MQPPLDPSGICGRIFSLG